MIYFAHRGLPALRVQNTTESFALARQKGAKYYELDVHLLKDGALVVHHDYSLLNTAGFDVKLADLTMADLKKYPLKNPFTNTTLTVPLLEDIIPLVLPELEILNIEIKNDDNVYPGIESVLLRALKKWPEIAPKILFSGFDYDSLVRLRALDKNARIGLLTRAFDVSKALALGAESVHINQTRLTQEVVRVCPSYFLRFSLSTVTSSPSKKTPYIPGPQEIPTIAPIQNSSTGICNSSSILFLK